jgi:hypothetical protein
VKTDTTPKITDRGALRMFIGYVDDHDGYVYHIWSPKTKRAHITCDIIWMKQMMFTKEVEEPTVEHNNDNEDGEGGCRRCRYTGNPQRRRRYQQRQRN